MAKARVTLTRALTHDGRGRKFVKGQPQVIDNDADIAYYKVQPEFTVTMLKAPPKKAPEPTPEPEPEGEAVVEEPTEHTADSLNKMTKTELIHLAASPPFDLALDNEMKKAEMVEAILEAQELMSEGDDD